MPERTASVVGLAIAALLSACGSDNGVPVNGPSEKIIHTTIASIGVRADYFVGTDLLVTNSLTPSPDRFQLECDGDTCTADLLVTTVPYTTVEATTFNGEEQDSNQVGTRSGVKIRQTTGADEAFDQIDFRGLGGWLDHSVFSSDRSTFNTGLRFISSAVLGVRTPSNPVSGELTWKGAMTGLDRLADDDPLIGDATITYNVGRQTIDLAVTNITTFDNGLKHDDMSWNGVPVIEGRFEQGDDGDYLTGSFFGPNHDEVAGAFERRQIVGAFGVKRQGEASR